VIDGVEFAVEVLLVQLGLSVGQWQAELEQTCPVEQAFPHPPQFAGSADESMHLPSQYAFPPAHAQVPPMHSRATSHVVPQLPQLSLSLATATHDMPHCVRPFAQNNAHIPCEQSSGHVVPQPPQLCGSLL
jgi:hypothetical protein